MVLFSPLNTLIEGSAVPEVFAWKSLINCSLYRGILFTIERCTVHCREV